MSPEPSHLADEDGLLNDLGQGHLEDLLHLRAPLFSRQASWFRAVEPGDGGLQHFQLFYLAGCGEDRGIQDLHLLNLNMRNGRVWVCGDGDGDAGDSFD